MNNDFPYTIIRREMVGIRDSNEVEDICHIGVWLYVVSDGRKYGLAYDTNDWKNDKYDPEYKLLTGCNWDHFNTLDTVYGCFVVAFSNGKCTCFSLIGKSDPVEESPNKWETVITVSAAQICDCIYDKITYSESASEDLLILYRKDEKQYYDLERNVLSERYDWIYPIHDEFIECGKGDEVFRINLNGKNPFPKHTGEEQINFVCRYNDGLIFIVFTNRRCDKNPFESYLVFYSEKEDVFCITEIYDKVNIFGVKKYGCAFLMSGFECLKNGKSVHYNASQSIWSDEDILSVPNVNPVQENQGKE